jgi:hypothetical protein
MIGAVSALTLSAAAFAQRRFGLIIACAALASIFAGLPISTVEAQSGVVGHGQKPGTRIPFKALRERPQLTPEQMRLQEERLQRHKDTHGGPQLPEAPASQTPAGAPTQQPAAAETQVLPIGGTFTIFQQTAQTYGAAILFQAETHAATSATNVVFYSGNVFASFSTDGGASFTFVNPFTQFDPLDGGLCCDQTVIYDPTRDLMIWQLQYFFSESTGKGSYRIAFANSASVASAGWCTYEFNPGDFGLDLSQGGFSLDRPEVALSSNFVWYSANIYSEPDAKFLQSVMWRIRLDPAANNCDPKTFDYFRETDTSIFSFTPVQGATDTMYWASIRTFPTGSIRIYQWPEADGSNLSSTDVPITAWPDLRPRLCPGPDGLNWCRVADQRQATGWISNGVIGFMWSASQMPGTFPYPYVHVARFTASTTPALMDEPIIWNSGGAFIYPAVGVNDQGAIAGTLYFGGGVFFPIMTALIMDDLSPAPPPWEVYSFVGSDAGANRWGDYYSSRRNPTNGNTWVITGQALSQGGVDAWYVWMGRTREATPTEMTSLGVQGTSPTSASSDYLRFWWEDVLRQRPPARSP